MILLVESKNGSFAGREFSRRDHFVATPDLTEKYRLESVLEQHALEGGNFNALKDVPN
jgi:hypothetical protein